MNIPLEEEGDKTNVSQDKLRLFLTGVALLFIIALIINSLGQIK